MGTIETMGFLYGNIMGYIMSAIRIWNIMEYHYDPIRYFSCFTLFAGMCSTRSGWVCDVWIWFMPNDTPTMVIFAKFSIWGTYMHACVVICYDSGS